MPAACSKARIRSATSRGVPKTISRRNLRSSSDVIGGGDADGPDRSRASSMSSYFHDTYRRCGAMMSHALGPFQTNVSTCSATENGRPPPSSSVHRTCSPHASGVSPLAMNPSAIRPARRTARSTPAPIQIGGPPARPGRGDTITSAPLPATGSPAPAPRSTSPACSRRCTRPPRPRAAEHLDGMLESLHALAELHAEPVELLGAPSEPEPQDQSSARDEVNGCGILRNADRIVQRDQQQAGADLDTAPASPDRGAQRKQRGRVRVVHEMMFGRPDRVEAELLRVYREVERLGVEVL